MREPDCLDQRQGHLVISDVFENEGCALPASPRKDLKGLLDQLE